MQERNKPGLDELRLGQRRGHAQNRLVRKERGAFGHGVDIPREPELREPVDEFAGEARAAREPVELVRGKTQVLEKLEHLLESGRDEEIARRGQLAHEEFERRDLGHAALVIGLQHRQLVEVREQGAGAGIARGMVHDC